MSGIEILLAIAIGILGGAALRNLLDGSWVFGTLGIIAAAFVLYQVFYA